MSRVVALITAGGSGTRMGTAVKKQYIELRNKPVLAHTVHRFEITEEVDEIILTAPAEDMEFVRKNIAEKYNFSKLRLIVPGGSSRQESVFSALDSLDLSENSIVLIHDAVRPFVDHSIIQSCIETLENSDGAVTAIVPVNTVKSVHSGSVVSTIDRNSLASVQTPQAFRFGLIKKCYEKAVQNGFNATDDSALVEKFGKDILGRPPVIKTVQGSSFNIKITDRNDLIIASAIIDSLSL